MASIRKMERSDVKAVHNIHCACLTKTLSKHYSAEQIQAWMAGRTPEGYWTVAAEGEEFLILEIGGNVVGYGSWQGNELFSLFIHPEYQGRGYGTFLFQACCKSASDSTGQLTFVKAAVGAESFYKSHGFRAEGSGYTEKCGIQIPDTRMSRHPD